MTRLLITCLAVWCWSSPVEIPAQQVNSGQEKNAFSTINFGSQDGVPITADLYLIEETDSIAPNPNRPFIILCHQAGWSRGEYREIAPKLNALGFNCLAIDQRSGGKVNDVENKTATAATQQHKQTRFTDAEQDILGAINFVRDKDHSSGELILWGSSYSAALVLRIAGENPELIDGVLAFAPGEYFARLGKPKDWIARSAKNINVPAFITSAKKEYDNWSAVFEAIPAESKTKFLPETEGNHGSRALWEQFEDSDAYWKATHAYLEPFRGPIERPAPDEKLNPVLDIDDIAGLPSRIAFGSCGHQDKRQPILATVIEKQRRPDLFIYLGDNIYGDTTDMHVLQAKYNKLGAKPEFQKLRAAVPVLSVWDDHDYGWNDAGKDYEFKDESKAVFMDFWRVAADSPRRQHAGIYGSHRFEKDGHSLQLILLDTRTFRDPLKRNRGAIPKGSGFKNDYQPDPDPEKTLLGEEQWKWLESTLHEPADVRIICSSIQFGHEYNGWESWTNLPGQQQRMVQLIRDTKANGIIFISGDVHWGEISKRNFDDLYPIYDVTASGLTEDWHNVEPNRFRIGKVVRDNHYGMIEIDWSQSDPLIQLMIVDKSGSVRNRHEVSLSDFQGSR